MPHRFRKFLALDSSSRRLLIQAFWQLGLARFNLLNHSFKKIVQGLEQFSGKDPQADLTDAQLLLAQQIGWSVSTAASVTPWESACLVQVLAAQRMLQARGIGGEFFIGAAREEGQGEPGFLAHAWLMCGDTFITGESGHERYTVVSGFRWG